MQALLCTYVFHSHRRRDGFLQMNDEGGSPVFTTCTLYVALPGHHAEMSSGSSALIYRLA